jgi:hypothetical protein
MLPATIVSFVAISIHVCPVNGLEVIPPKLCRTISGSFAYESLGGLGIPRHKLMENVDLRIISQPGFLSRRHAG